MTTGRQPSPCLRAHSKCIIQRDNVLVSHSGHLPCLPHLLPSQTRVPHRQSIAHSARHAQYYVIRRVHSGEVLLSSPRQLVDDSESLNRIAKNMNADADPAVLRLPSLLGRR